jgi:hypothetical protein
MPVWPSLPIFLACCVLGVLFFMSVMVWFEGRGNHIDDIKGTTGAYGHKKNWYLNTYKSRWFSGVYNLGWKSAKNWRRPNPAEIKERNKARLEGKPKPVKLDPNDVVEVNS